MALTITDTAITSDLTAETARASNGRWFVTCYLGRAMDRAQAITAMTLAEERSRPHPDLELIDSLEGELA